MPRFILGDLRTGRRILDLDVISGSWDDRLNAAESIRVTMDMQSDEIRSLDLRNAATPCKAFLGVAEGDTILAAGPIWKREYDRDDQKITLSAKGMLSYFDHRQILPLVALTTPVTNWSVPDPADASKMIPNPALATDYVNLSLGTITKRLVAQARAWTGGNVPIVFQADETGVHERHYDGLEFKSVGDIISGFSDLEDGVDVNFLPRFTSDGLGVEWLLQTGTNAAPLISSQSVHVWDVGVEESPVTNLMIDEDGSDVGSLSWATGGRFGDKVLVARAYDSTLVSNGFPLLEIRDTSHSSVIIQKTLDGYAAESAKVGRRLVETWTFDVEAFPTDDVGNAAGPQAGQFNVGDFCQLVMAGDPYIADGVYQHRIVGLSGDQDGNKIGVQCAPSQGT